MISKAIIYLAIGLLIFNQTSANDLSLKPIETETLNWISPPPVPGLQFTWITGSEKEKGLYALRVKLKKGTKIPPHTHPDKRLSTVLSGTLYVGFGETLDESRLVRIKQGNSYVAPAATPHFIWAKDGAVEYQETGIGPTATKILQP